MKRILFGWIEQIIEFNSYEERKDFIKKTKGVKVVESYEVNDKYNLHVKRPYNKNKMK